MRHGDRSKKKAEEQAELTRAPSRNRDENGVAQHGGDPAVEAKPINRGDVANSDAQRAV